MTSPYENNEWYDEDWDEDEEEYNGYENDYGEYEGDYIWEADDYEPLTLRQRLYEWWRDITWFDKCDACGKQLVVFGRFIGDHKKCSPF